MAEASCAQRQRKLTKLPMIENKTIWITGASSGIGSELAVQLASTANTVVVSARGQEKLAALVGRAEALSGRIIPLVYDVIEDEQTESVTGQLSAVVDNLDIVIICAGYCEYVDNAVLKTDLFRRVFDVNVFGAVNTVNAAMPLLENTVAAPGERGKPQIVAIASLSAVTALPRAEAYGASKAAMIYLFNTLRLDLQNRIDVTIVNPGFVSTPMTAQNDFPMPFLMSPSDAAKRIISGVYKRKYTLNFPLRLYLSLKLPSLIPYAWHRWLGPRLVRPEKS